MSKAIFNEAVTETNNYLNWLKNTLDAFEALKKQPDNVAFIDIQIQLEQNIFSLAQWDIFNSELSKKIDAEGYLINKSYWQQLTTELKRAAKIQHDTLALNKSEEDYFSSYAELYDSVNGKRNFDYIDKEIKFIHDKFQLDFKQANILSIGCGTGIIEAHLLETLNLNKRQLLGIDISQGMITIAARRINARVENILFLNPKQQRWNINLCTGNVLQYLPQELLEPAIKNIAAITQTNGCFIGDFITPDHPVRAYPNILRSENVLLLRTPLLIEKNHALFQQTRLINVSRLHDEFSITDEGKHTRHLSSLWKMRYLFTKYFAQVEFFDAMTLEPLEQEDDTCPSTRYLVFAQI